MSLTGRFTDLLATASVAATPNPACAHRLACHLTAAVLCPERGTVTNLICTSGGQHQDWSAHYRLYERGRVDEHALFATARRAVEAALPAGEPLVVMVDDTLTRKTGRHIHGVGWKRDPLGPAFQTNLVRGQRYLQFCAAWPLEHGGAQTLPIDLLHAPSATPLPRNPSDEQRQAQREEQKQRNLNAYTLQSLRKLRAEVGGQRSILLCGDGSYTNQVILRGLPEHTHYLGRMRKDAVLHHLPEAVVEGKTGRRPSYGALAPTPEELRQDQSHPWQRVPAYAAGKEHEFRVKELGPVLWRKAGAALRVRIIVIAPLGYRPRQGAKLQYRAPAYLLTTDLDSPLQKLVQHYLWRWGIEVNFRDEKQLLGLGEAQVRNAASNQHQPASIAAAYSLLWVAALQGREAGDMAATFTPPKWRKKGESSAARDPMPSTGELQRQMRYEAWAGAIRAESLSDFSPEATRVTKWEKPRPSLSGAIFAAA